MPQDKQEIWEQMSGHIHHFVVGVGTVKHLVKNSRSKKA